MMPWSRHWGLRSLRAWVAATISAIAVARVFPARFAGRPEASFPAMASAKPQVAHKPRRPELKRQIGKKQTPRKSQGPQHKALGHPELQQNWRKPRLSHRIFWAV